MPTIPFLQHKKTGWTVPAVPFFRPKKGTSHVPVVRGLLFPFKDTKNGETQTTLSLSLIVLIFLSLAKLWEVGQMRHFRKTLRQ